VPNPYAPPDPTRPRPERPTRPSDAPSPRPPADPAGSARATGLARTAFQLLLASIVLNFVRAPWSASSLAFTTAALVTAIRSLVVAARARANGQVTVPALVVAGAAAIGLVLGALSLALMPAKLAYQACVHSALTVQAGAQCTDDNTKRIADLMKVTGISPTG
jgi:hypothetical protein